MIDKNDDNGLSKAEMLIIILGFSTLGLGLTSIISIKSTLGFLSFFHDHYILFNAGSIGLFLTTVYIDKKYNQISTKNQRDYVKI